ncbi:MAG: T9SS type A sorting domain-containing protein [Candidatus Aegiribacteria sp.]|nr:T9SS type A sorting domain-containing protein [Candidatus Aegiribacteria sp.]
MNSLLKLSFSILIITSLLQADTFFRTYDVEGGTEFFHKAIELPDGRFAGMRRHWGTNPSFGGLMFFDTNGDSTAYIDEIYEYAFCLTADSSLVFVIGVGTWSLLWTDLDGNILDEVVITGIQPNGFASDIVQALDGGYFLCGEGYAVKVDGSGVYEWHLFLDADLWSVIQGEDGTFLAGGQASNPYRSDYIVNISNDGIIQWEWSYPGPMGVWGVQAVAGGFAATSTDNRITMFSASGDTLWNYSSEHSDVEYCGITVSGTDIIACGCSDDDSLSVVSRLDSNGFLIWERDYTECGFNSIESTMDGGFILAGVYPYPFDTETASLLVKTDSEGWYGGIGIEPEQTVYNLDLEVYPNPASAYTILNFNLDSASPLSLLVFDISGRCVLEFPETQFNPGNNKIQIEGLGSGIYFCRMISGDFTATQQFVVID